jgi:hypothetical protein
MTTITKKFIGKRTHCHNSPSPPLTNRLIIETTVLIKSLLTSLCQREVLYASLAKRGKGRFSDLCTFNFETLNNLKRGLGGVTEINVIMLVNPSVRGHFINKEVS